MAKRKKYSKEIKLDAISLVRDQNLSISEASRSLGIGNQMLGRWIKVKMGKLSFQGNGKLTPDQEEVRKLKGVLRPSPRN